MTTGPQSEPVLVLATGNRHKYSELRQVLKSWPVRLQAAFEFPDLPEAIEDGVSFAENAGKKARHYARLLRLPCLADDTGLVVEALDGRPGVHSARYAGPGATDADNCAKLLSEMAGQSNRRAHFACVLALASPNGALLTWEGRCEGELITTPRGNSGFGYDPLFLLPERNLTLAEIPLEDKSGFSHRGRALAGFLAEFETVLAWLRRHDEPSGEARQRRG